MNENKNNNSTLIIGIVVVVLALLGVGAYILLRGNTNAPSGKTTTSTTTNTKTATNSGQTRQPKADSGKEETTIKYDGFSFSPATVTVKAGSKVIFVNNSSGEVVVNSNPHPAHTDNTELNIDAISPGQSGSATITNIGTFGYHNHLKSGQGGTIVVE